MNSLALPRSLFMALWPSEFSDKPNPNRNISLQTEAVVYSTSAHAIDKQHLNIDLGKIIAYQNTFITNFTLPVPTEQNGQTANLSSKMVMCFTKILYLY